MRLDRQLTLHIFSKLIKKGFNEKSVRIPILMYHSVSTRDDCAKDSYFEINTVPQIFYKQMRYLANNGYFPISLEEAVSLIARETTAKFYIKRLTDTRNNKFEGCNDEVTMIEKVKHVFRNGMEKKGDRSIISKVHYYKRMPSSLNKLFKKYYSYRPVVITFDDGFRDFYTTAWPILKSFGFTASLFLPTAFISNRRKKIKERECLTWSEVRELSTDGVDFGGHTVSHVQLCHLKRATAEREIRDAKAAIEQELGLPVTHYSYAYAFPEHDRRFVSFFRSVLVDAGYSAAVTTRIGIAVSGEDPFTLKRLPVNSGDDEAFFRAKLQGAYNWLAWPQRLLKILRRRAGA